MAGSDSRPPDDAAGRESSLLDAEVKRAI